MNHGTTGCFIADLYCETQSTDCVPQIPPSAPTCRHAAHAGVARSSADWRCSCPGCSTVSAPEAACTPVLSGEATCFSDPVLPLKRSKLAAPAKHNLQSIAFQFQYGSHSHTAQPGFNIDTHACCACMELTCKSLDHNQVMRDWLLASWDSQQVCMCCLLTLSLQAA